MSMRTTSPRRRKHVLMRLRQRVDPRRCRWAALCRAVEMSLVVHTELGAGRDLVWFTYRNAQVFAVWDRAAEELVTVLGDDYAAVLRWKAQLRRGEISEAS